MGSLGIAARTARIDRARRRFHRQSLGAEYACSTCDLVHGLAAHMKTHEERANLGIRRGTGHDGFKRLRGLDLVESLPDRDLFYGCPQIF